MINVLVSAAWLLVGFCAAMVVGGLTGHVIDIVVERIERTRHMQNMRLWHSAKGYKKEQEK